MKTGRYGWKPLVTVLLAVAVALGVVGCGGGDGTSSGGTGGVTGSAQ